VLVLPAVLRAAVAAALLQRDLDVRHWQLKLRRISGDELLRAIDVMVAGRMRGWAERGFDHEDRVRRAGDVVALGARVLKAGDATAQTFGSFLDIQPHRQPLEV